jgi:hypothetical protein
VLPEATREDDAEQESEHWRSRPGSTSWLMVLVVSVDVSLHGLHPWCQES